MNITTLVLAVSDAQVLLRKLEVAIEEAKDHETTQAAYCPELEISIHVNPHKLSYFEQIAHDCHEDVKRIAEISGENS